MTNDEQLKLLFKEYAEKQKELIDVKKQMVGLYNSNLTIEFAEKEKQTKTVLDKISLLLKHIRKNKWGPEVECVLGRKE